MWGSVQNSGYLFNIWENAFSLNTWLLNLRFKSLTKITSSEAFNTRQGQLFDVVSQFESQKIFKHDNYDSQESNT